MCVCVCVTQIKPNDCLVLYYITNGYISEYDFVISKGIEQQTGETQQIPFIEEITSLTAIYRIFVDHI